MFVRDFGRGVLGISIGSVLIGACGESQTAAATTVAGAASTTTTAGPPASTTAGQPTTTITITITGTKPLTVERVALGSVSAYLMVRGTEVAIVDTGSGGRAGDIEGALVVVGLGWSSVGTVILTHKHGDHVGSLAAVLREVTGAVVGAGAANLDGIGGGAALTPLAHGQTVFGTTIIATPGHTDGHISVWDESTRVLVAGDALNGGGSGVLITDGVGGPNPQFTPDMSSAIESARTLARLEPDTIFFGHGDPKRGDDAAALNDLVAGL